jgi:hypothetical protein
MPTLSRSIPTTLALSISLGAPAFSTSAASAARTPASMQASTIYACVSKKGGTLRVSAAPLKCKRGETQVAWRAVAARAGTRGLEGNPGPAGAPGAPGARGETGLRGEAGPKGEQGLAGVKGETGAEGREGIVWKGAWSPSTTYKLKEAVFYEGSSYISIRESPENKGKTPSTEPSYWELVAKEGKQGKGETGEKGVTGEKGATGPEGKEGIVWKGGWSASTTYKLKEAVFYEGSSYISIRESPENKGKTPSTEPSYWELVAKEGKQGAAGVEGREGIVWKGTWSASTTYKLKEAVFYEGSSYISIRESPENKGKTPSTEPSYWELVAKEGKQGVKGETGEKGPAGGFPVGKYESAKEAKTGEELEPSKTEPVQVTLIVSGEKEKEATSKVTVEGKTIAETLGGNALSTTKATVTFIVPAGQKWKVTATAVTKLEYTYLTI